MPERTGILETNVELEDGRVFFVQVAAEIPDEADGLVLDFYFVDPDGVEICKVKYKGTITNPIELATIFIGAIGNYGYCVGKNYAIATGVIVHNTYKESKEKEPKMEVEGRYKDIMARLPEKSDEFKNKAVSALKKCVAALFFLDEFDDE